MDEIMVVGEQVYVLVDRRQRQTGGVVLHWSTVCPTCNQPCIVWTNATFRSVTLRCKACRRRRLGRVVDELRRRAEAVSPR